MKFGLTSIVLLASLGAVFAQDSSSTSSSASSSSSSAVSSSSSTMASSSSSAAAGGGAGSATSAAAAAATCTLVSGDPDAQQFGCPAGATTSTPPYDSASLQSFQIDAYTPGKEGVAIDQVATQMAKTVTMLYPTLTVPFSDIVEQYVTALEASATHFVPDGAALAFGIPSGLGSMALVAVAAVAGGAFVL